MMRILLLALCLATVLPAGAQATRYVTDNLPLELRSGPTTGHRILTMVESGTRVEVLEESGGWSRVRVAGGGQGWILSRFLMERPAARMELEAALTERDSARAERERMAAELGGLQERAMALEQERDELARRSRELAAELADLRRTAGAAITLQEENQRLGATVEELDAALLEARQRVTTLVRREQQTWFLSGAGVLLGGMLLGLIIPRIRWRRRKGWNEL
jgi:SH3 domain protein